MMHTNRTDFSKYKHGKKKDITKKVKETFGDNSDFKQFIEGTALIYEDENADYPDVPNIELSDHTCDVIKTTVKNTWSKAKATSDYTKFSGRLVQLCAWMINEICSQYLEGKKPDRYKELDDKFRKLEDISFEKLDECAISNLEEWRKKVKHVSDTLDIIIRYKKLKDKK
jgi:hypothetical protein